MPSGTGGRRSALASGGRKARAGLLEQTTQKAIDSTRGVPLDLTTEERQKRSTTMKGTARRLLATKGHCNNTDRPWTLEEIALLGTGPDVEIAAKVGQFRE